MHVPSTQSSTRALPHTRRIITITLSTALFVLATVLPAVRVEASPASATPDSALSASVSALPPLEVKEVFAGIPLEALSAIQLSELISQLPGLSALPAGRLQEALTTAIEALAAQGGTLGQLTSPTELVPRLETQLNQLLTAPELLSLLKGQSLTSVLTGALATLEPSQLLGGMLGSAANPEQLIGQVLAAASPGKLETLLGTTLTGTPFTKTTVGELASQLGTTAQGLAEALNTTSSQLPATAMALTTTLTNGEILGVLNGIGGVSLSLLGPSQEKTPGGSGSGSGAGGSGGSGDGASGTYGGTTLVVNNPALQSTTALGSKTKTTRSKLKIISRKVKGNAVTIIVQVPAAGKLTLAGSGVRSAGAQTDKAERVTLRTTLTKATVASLHKHHRRLKLKLTASFKQVGGPSSSRTTTIAFG
jgi:hypothetical protein